MRRFHSGSTFDHDFPASIVNLEGFSSHNLPFAPRSALLPHQASSWSIDSRKAQHSAFRNFDRNSSLLPSIVWPFRFVQLQSFLASLVTDRLILCWTASSTFDSNLVKATAAATLREYSVALEGISSAVSSATSAAASPSTIVSLQASLSIAMILLRDGPEGNFPCSFQAFPVLSLTQQFLPAGSVKLSSSALSDLLRHLSLLVESVASQAEQNEQAARTYLLVATFLDGVCADRVSPLNSWWSSSIYSLTPHSSFSPCYSHD